MKPLAHSFPGLLRSSQLSRTQLFVFVEGKNSDGFFYGKICEKSCATGGQTYRIQSAGQIRDSSGGKTALLRFHDYLKKKSSLTTKLGSKTTTIAFCLDKDVDDLLGSMVDCKHLVYTEGYDVENYLFQRGNLVASIAATASIDELEVATYHRFQRDWCETIAMLWKDWVVICLYCHKNRVGVTNYRAMSRINHPYLAEVDANRRSALLDTIATKQGCSRQDLETDLGSVAALVEKLYQASRYGGVFRGKWFVTLLELEINEMLSTQGRNPVSSISKSLCSTLALTLDFSEPWAKRLIDSISSVLEPV